MDTSLLSLSHIVALNPIQVFVSFGPLSLRLRLNFFFAENWFANQVQFTDLGQEGYLPLTYLVY